MTVIAERRHSDRIPCANLVHIETADAAVQTGLLWDVSIDGAALLSVTAVEPGSIISLKSADGVGAEEQVKVIRAQSRAEGGWVLGCVSVQG